MLEGLHPGKSAEILTQEIPTLKEGHPLETHIVKDEIRILEKPQEESWKVIILDVKLY